MFVLLDDQMNSVIKCLTAKSTWDDLILYHEGPSDVKESRVMDLKLCYNTFKFKVGESITQTFTKYKALMNELVNDGIKLLKLEINTGFINGLPKKWLSFCQSLRNTNNVKGSEHASLFGKLKYEENLIDSIYETEKNKSLVSTTRLSTAVFSTSIVQDFQDSPEDEEDTRSSHEYLNDLKEEYQVRALLAKSKRFFKKGTQGFMSAKATDQTECHKCGKKGHFARDCWSKTSDDKEVLSDENEVTEVTALIALTDEESVLVGKESARNGYWTKISMKSNIPNSSETEDSTPPNQDTDEEKYFRYLSVAKKASLVDKVAMFLDETGDIAAARSKDLENSKVFFSIHIGGIFREVGVNTFRNAICTHYLPHSSKYVEPPSIDVVRQWFPTIGYEKEVSAKGTL
nr:retrovirus-related Pol polyprotein from transposon TNT 1-94 [Tanacetum cinerariifolium]